jgi:hypothetical protein
MAATLTLRSVKGAPLTNNEVDSNFTNLNTEISTIEGDITTLQTDLNTAEGAISVLQGDVVGLQNAALDSAEVANIVGTMVTGNTESGISVTYEASDNTLDFNVSDWTITVDGDASGSATVTDLTNTTLTLDINNISGDLTISGNLDAANFNSTSDVALKENLNIIDSPLEKIAQLNGYTFNWKQNQKEAVGIVAQEVEKVFPQIVTTGADGIKRVSYDSLIPVMLEAIKELAKR